MTASVRSRSRDGFLIVRVESAEIAGKLAAKWRKETEGSRVEVNDEGPDGSPPSRVLGDASFRAGDGETEVVISGESHFGGRLNLRLGDGESAVTIDDSRVDRELRITGGREVDEFNFRDSDFGARVRVTTRAISSGSSFERCELSGGLDLRGTSGDDRLIAVDLQEAAPDLAVVGLV